MSGMFGGGASAQQQEIYAGIQVSSSILGAPLPYVAGRQRIPFNLAWYGNFQVSTSNSGGGKGGGGNSTKQYSYSAAFIAALCLGPITGIFQIWHDKALETLTSENLAIAYGGATFNGSIAGTTLTVHAPVQGFVTNGVLTGNGVFVKTFVTGQLTGPAGGAGTYTVGHSQTVALTSMFVAQPNWSGYPSGTPAVQQIPYDHIAYVASSAYNLGSSAGMPDLTFEVEGVVPGFSDANGIFDADPSAVLPNYLLDGVIGALANYPGTPLIIGSSDAPLTGVTNSFQSYCLAMGLLTSPYEYTQRQATDFTAEFLQCVNSDVFLSYGTLKVFPYADQPVSAVVAGTTYSYTPNLTPVYILGPDDYIVDDGDNPEPPVKLQVTAKSDTFNEVNVEYLDRSNYYNAAPVNCNDDDDIAKYGPRLASSLSWHQITIATVAKTAGTLWLQKQLREVNRYLFKTRRDYSLLEPGIDFVALNTIQPIPGSNSGLGLVNQLCQVESVEVSDEDETLSFVVREIPGVTRSTAQFNWAAAQGYFANQATDPGAVQTPLIFQMPPLASSDSSGITIGVAVCGQTANAAWLGCDVYASVDGGTTYQLVGRMPEACRYGKLTTNLPQVPDPDTSSTLSIALANTNLQISTAVTHADADSIQTPILVYGGTAAEVMSFGAAALVSAGHYNLSYLRRNIYGTTDQVHSATNEGGSGAAANFVRLDGALFQVAIDPGMAGQTINFKFVSFNSWQQYGPQTLSGSTAYPYTVPTGITVEGDFIASGNAAVVDTTAYKIAGAAGAWDSSVYSRQAFTNGCSISAYPNTGTQSGTMVGLTVNPTLSNSFTNLAFALYATSSAVIQIYEAGTLIGNFFGAYSSATLLNVTYDGKHVSYWINGVLVRSVPIANLTLFAQLCFFGGGDGAFGIDFTPSGTAVTPFTLVPMSLQVAAAGTQAISNSLGSSAFGTRNFQSAESYNNGCQISFGVNENAYDAMFLGLSTAPATGASPAPYGPVLAAWYPHVGSGITEIIFNNVDLGSFGSPVTVGEVLTITYDNFTFKWWRNGALIHQEYFPSAGPLFLFGDMFDPGGEGFLNISFSPYGLATPQIWTARGNAIVSDEVVSKNGGASAWDSDAISISGYPNCHLLAVSGNAALNAAISLNTGAPPSLATLAAFGMSYSLVTDSSGNIDIWESGISVAPAVATYNVNDVLSMVYTGTAVLYKKNGTLLRTTTVTTGVNMFADVALFDPGSAFNNVEFGPSSIFPVTNTGKIAGNAVSQMASNFNATAVVNTSTVSGVVIDTTVISVTVATTGAPMAIDAMTVGSWNSVPNGSPSTALLSVYRDGAIVASSQYDASQYVLGRSGPSTSPQIPITLSVTDSPAAGTHTYELHYKAQTTGPSTGSVTATLVNNFIKVREIKK